MNRAPREHAPRHRVLRASIWSFALLATEKLIGVARIVVLAVLLSPHDFGLFGIATLSMLAVEAISRTGFQEALIRERGDVRRHLDVAWSVHLLRGLLLALLLGLGAPQLAAYYDEPASALLIQALAVSLILQGLTNIGVVYFHRELDFRKEFTYRLSGTVADFLVAVVAAWFLGTAWALVLGLLAGALVRCIVSYRIHPYRPRFFLQWQSLRHLFSYGIWLSLTGILIFAGSQAAGLVVGKLAGASALGLYQMAYRIPQIAIREVSAALETIALPAYALIQEDKARLRRSYLGFSGLIMALAAPAAFGIVIIGPPFTGYLLGQAWMPMVPALTLLAIAALFKVLAATGRPLFLACGVPKFNFYVYGGRALALALLIYPLTMRWGIQGAALCMVITALVGGFLWIHGTRRLLRLTTREFATTMVPPLLSALAMGALLYPLRAWTHVWVPEILLPRLIWMGGLAATGLAIYLAGLWLSLRFAPASVTLETATAILERRGIRKPGGCQ